MQPEDRLRSGLRDAASRYPVGAGSLSGVQARASALGRRRVALRSGMGLFALVAVALVGVATLGDGGREGVATAVSSVAAASAETEAGADGTSAADSVLGADTAGAQLSQADRAEAPADDGAEDGADNEAGDKAAADGAPVGPRFASTVRAVVPPAGAGPGPLSYRFHGSHVVAHGAGSWFAFDGIRWHDAEAPGGDAPRAQARRGEDRAAVVLHETTMFDLAMRIEVSGGAAWLKYDDNVWEICPIPDVDAAHGEIGRVGNHLALIVAVPEQALYLLERVR